MKKYYNPLLLLLVSLGLISALWLNYQRHTVEKANNTVEIAMEYAGLRKLAALAGAGDEEVFARFQEAGVTTLVFYETTLAELEQEGVLYAASAAELQKARNLASDLGVFSALATSADFTQDAVYLASGADTAVFQDVLTDLRCRCGEAALAQVSSDPAIYRVRGSTHFVSDEAVDEPLGLWQAPLGIARRDLERAAAWGFHSIVRPSNYAKVTKAEIDAFFQRIASSGVRVHALLPRGKEVLGYPDLIDYTAQKMQENAMQLLLLEHYTQLQFYPTQGLEDLAAALDYRASRVYLIDNKEQKKLSIAAAERRWALADEERNIRVNYLRPFFLAQDGQDILTQNLNYVRAVKASVTKRGFSFNLAGVFSASLSSYAPYFPAKSLLILPLAAVWAGAVLLLAELVSISRRRQNLLWLLCTALSAAALFLSGGIVLRQALALLAAVVFPCLALSVLLHLWDKLETPASLARTAFTALWQLALATALSLVGGLLLSALLSDSRFFLEIDIYRGVKLTFILPLVMMELLALRHYDLLGMEGQSLSTRLARWRAFFATKLALKHLLLLAVLLFAAYIFLGRSGHSAGVPVPALELKLRYFLEDFFYARPREKEFLIGHPAFFLAVYAAYLKAPQLWRYALAIAAVIGQGSLVETFAHMRTPVCMSLWRAFDGYLVGACFGIAALLFAALFLKLYKQLQRRISAP